MASTAVCAATLVVNGPRHAAVRSGAFLTMLSRGKASSVRTTQTTLAGARDRRLYGGWCAAISRCSRTCASSACAHSTWSTRSASVHHVLDPAAGLGRGEIGAHPLAQVARRADVQHLVARPAEQIDARRGGHPVGQVPLAPPGRRDVPCHVAQLGQALHAERAERSNSACSTSTVALASVSARWSGATREPSSGASAPSRTLGASSRVSTLRASCTVSTTAGRGQGRPSRRAGRLQEADVEPGVVRDQHGAADELQEGGQHGDDARGVHHHRCR